MIPVVRELTVGQSGRKRTSASGTMPKLAAFAVVRKTSAVCSSAFAGMQPRLRQVPPTVTFSTMATRRPRAPRVERGRVPARAPAEHHDVVVAHVVATFRNVWMTSAV